MFFVLSKIAGVVLLPLNLLFAVVLAGAVAWRLGRHRLTKGMLWLAAIAYVAIGHTQLSDLLLDRLEMRIAPAAIPADVAGIIVLGGGIDTNGPPEQPTRFGEGGIRLIHALQLRRTMPDARLIYTGGRASLVRSGRPEAEGAGEILAALGQDPDRIELETKSRNTAENAAYVAAMLAADRDRPWLLVTSAFHMPRALGCFRHVGINAIASPTDYRANRLAVPYLAENSLAQFAKFALFIKEAAGLAAYRLTDRTDSLLPR